MQRSSVIIDPLGTLFQIVEAFLWIVIMGYEEMVILKEISIDIQC